MITDNVRVGKSAPMDRYTARRLADAIKSIAGYRVVRTYTAPASAGAYVIDVLDTITKLPYTVTDPASWLDVRGASSRERHLMVARNTFPASHTATPEASDVAEAPDDPAPAPLPAREEPKTMTQSTGPAPTQQSSGGFNFAQWKTITASAIEKAEAEISRLQGERGQLEEQLRRRRLEIDGQVADLRGTVKKLQRAIDDVDRPAKASAATNATPSQPRTGPTAPKWGAIALAWAKEHDGDIIITQLAKANGVESARLYGALNTLAERRVVEKIKAGHFRVVTP